MLRRASDGGDKVFRALLRCAGRQGIEVYDSGYLDACEALRAEDISGCLLRLPDGEFIAVIPARLKKDKQERARVLAHEIAHYLINHVLQVPFDPERYRHDMSYRERKEAEAEDGAKWLLRVFGAEVAGESNQPNQPTEPQRPARAAV